MDTLERLYVRGAVENTDRHRNPLNTLLDFPIVSTVERFARFLGARLIIFACPVFAKVIIVTTVIGFRYTGAREAIPVTKVSLCGRRHPPELDHANGSVTKIKLLAVRTLGR